MTCFSPPSPPVFATSDYKAKVVRPLCFVLHWQKLYISCTFCIRLDWKCVRITHISDLIVYFIHFIPNFNLMAFNRNFSCNKREGIANIPEIIIGPNCVHHCLALTL